MKSMKRSIALLLVVLTLLGALSGIGAATNEVSEDTEQQDVIEQVDEIIVEASESDAESPFEDFGTVIDPVTGEEHPILPSVDDIIPENLDELVAIGEASEANRDDEGESDTEADTSEDETEHTEICLDDFADQYDTSEVSEVDLSSNRIMVSADSSDIITEDAVIAELDGLYLMQFEDEETTALAYLYYNDNADFADADIPIMIADDDVAVAIEDADVTPIGMDEASNPFTEAQSTIEEIQGSETDTSADRPVIALIDTGVNSGPAEDRYSVMGDDGADRHGHGTRMAEIISGICPDARIISIKATDDNGIGSASSLFAAIQIAMELKADIINLSLYGKATEENMCIAEIISAAAASGIQIVGAAGNSSADASGYIPGSIGSITIVGSLNDEGEIASFSNRGDSVDYYVKSASTSEAAALVSGFLSLGSGLDRFISEGKTIVVPPEYLDDSEEEENENLSEDNVHQYGDYVFSDAVDSLDGCTANLFIWNFLTPCTKTYDYIPLMIDHMHTRVNRDNYVQILLGAEVWSMMDEENRNAVDKALQLASGNDSLTFAELANDAYVWLLRYDDGYFKYVETEAADVTLDEDDLRIADNETGKTGIAILYRPSEIIDVPACRARAQVNPMGEDGFEVSIYTGGSAFDSSINYTVVGDPDWQTAYEDNTSAYLTQYNGYTWYPYAVGSWFAFCIDVTRHFPDGQSVGAWGSDDWDQLSTSTKNAIVQALFYGIYSADFWSSSDYSWRSAALAVQTAIWSAIEGSNPWAYHERNTNISSSYYNTTAFNAVLQYLDDLSYLHGVIPSFSYTSISAANNHRYTLTDDGDMWSITFTESNIEYNYSQLYPGYTLFEKYYTFEVLNDSGSVVYTVTPVDYRNGSPKD